MRFHYTHTGTTGHDFQLMRWNGADPLAAAMPYQSPYSYMGANPINRIDPTGGRDIVVGLVGAEVFGNLAYGGTSWHGQHTPVAGEGGGGGGGYNHAGNGLYRDAAGRYVPFTEVLNSLRASGAISGYYVKDYSVHQERNGVIIGEVDLYFRQIGGEGRFRTSVDARNCGCPDPPCGIDWNSVGFSIAGLAGAALEITGGASVLGTPFAGFGVFIIVDGSSRAISHTIKILVALNPKWGLKASEIPGNFAEAAVWLVEKTSDIEIDTDIKFIISTVYDAATFLVGFSKVPGGLDNIGIIVDKISRITQPIVTRYEREKPK